ncbi:MAG: DUF4199 domain-containing protein [Ferruginibacter sp.]
MKHISATIKGSITGTVMVVISILIFYYKGNFENKFQYMTYLTYIVGILWTLIDYKHKEPGPKTFKNYFSQGFKCFIVVTFMMVAFTWIFLQLNPSFKEQMAIQSRAEFEKAGNYTPAEIDSMIARSKQYYVTMLTSIAIFGYLVIGSLVTVISSAFLSQRSRENA